MHLREGYNHIGDISFDGAEGGRVLLPLECYVPNGPNGGNPCLHGSIGVLDPATLQWRYYVKLDPAEIPKAMWNEVSPDGSLIWTSSGDDLLAYRAADVTAANAAPEHPPIHSVRRLRGAVPPSGITGATFIDGRLYVAGQGGGPFRVWSIDLADGSRRLEIERTIVGESEGLVTARIKDGTLSWLIQPFDPGGGKPTYDPDSATLRELPLADRRAARRTGGRRRRGARALDPLLQALAQDGAEAARLRGRRAVPPGLHGAARGPARTPGARPHDQARAGVGRPRGARAGEAHACRAAGVEGAHGPASAAAPGRAGDAFGRGPARCCAALR